MDTVGSNVLCPQKDRWLLRVLAISSGKCFWRDRGAHHPDVNNTLSDEGHPNGEIILIYLYIYSSYWFK